MPNHWLIKSEPESYSWAQMKKDSTTYWDGVRNFQARNNMKEMKNGDLAFFYHSGAERRILGIVEVVRQYYPDHTDKTGKFGMVDFSYVKDLKKPVALKEIKSHEKLQDIPLVRHSRLSVMPLSSDSWNIILNLSESSS